jgi:hypothetical protein
MKTTIGYGSTVPGATAWRAYNKNSLLVDIDTSAAGFTTTPLYFTSLGGRSRHWEAQGGSAIYQATATGFRIYIQPTNRESSTPYTPEKANELQWHVQWFGVAAD